MTQSGAVNEPELKELVNELQELLEEMKEPGVRRARSSGQAFRDAGRCRRGAD